MKIRILIILFLAINLSLRCHAAMKTNPSIHLLLLNNSTIIIQDGIIRSFLPGEYINYESYGSFRDQYYVNYGGAYGCYYNEELYDHGAGNQYYYTSLYNGIDLPELTTVNRSIYVGSFFTSQSIYDINQENVGNYTVYRCEDGSKPNFPNGVTMLESPLSIGKKWSHNQYCNGILNNEYEVVDKEIIVTPIGKIESFKITYSSSGTFPNGSYFDSWHESGNLWVHPKIGIIKQSFIADNMPYCRHKLCCFEKYRIELIIKSTNIDYSHFVRQ